MRVHVVQKRIDNVNLTPFLQQAEQAGADLICFGELAASGCLYTAPETVTPLEELLAGLEPYSMRVMLGFPHATDEGLRNAYLYYHRGEYQLYYKINLFPPMNEPTVYLPGDQPGLFHTDLGTIGAAICYDVRFPELFSQLKAGGAEMVVIPAAFPRVRIDQWRSLVIERARQTGLTTIGINAVGDDGTNEFGGTSIVVTGEGTVLAEADQTGETVLTVEL
ncbi:MAG: hypothetical protein D6800_15130 [Candidatus Zixiibacteriota bacterium]|nr:MAG: hypothetical protein D6800_15130 [candidate division Zixibacteria bacterium]